MSQVPDEPLAAYHILAGLAANKLNAGNTANAQVYATLAVAAAIADLAERGIVVVAPTIEQPT